MMTSAATDTGAQRPAHKDTKMGLPVPHITTFCWCLGLEMGAKLVAYLHLLVSLCFVVLCSVYAHKFHQNRHTIEDEGDRVYSTWYKISVTVAVVSVGHVLLALTLLYGVYKRSTIALRVWAYLMAALWVAALVLNLVGVAYSGVSGSGSDMFLAILEATLFYGFLVYCILCVYSYFLLVKSNEDMAGPQTQY